MLASPATEIRAAYAIIENGKVEFRRVAYDVDKTLRHMRDSGIDDAVVAKAEVVLRTGGNPTSTGIADP